MVEAIAGYVVCDSVQPRRPRENKILPPVKFILISSQWTVMEPERTRRTPKFVFINCIMLNCVFKSYYVLICSDYSHYSHPSYVFYCMFA